jgi:hypothetical protein
VAEVRKFEVMMYGTKEEEVIYDPKGKSTKGTKAPVDHLRPNQEGIHIPWLHGRRVVEHVTLAC